MTVGGNDVGSSRPDPRSAVPPSPRRMSRPKWLNTRVVVGVLVVVGAVVLGARVVGAQRQLSYVWATTTDLQAGTVLSGDDLTELEVNLDDTAGRYFGSSAPIVGKQLTRALGAGEIVPVAAVGDPVADTRLLALTVAGDQMLPGLTRGSVIDVYLVQGSGTDLTTALAAADLTVQEVTAPSSGGLSGAGSSGYQIVVRLPTKSARELVTQLSVGTVKILLHPAG